MNAPAFKTWEQAVMWLREQPEQQAMVMGSYYEDPPIDAAQRYWRSGEWSAIRELLPAACGPALRRRALDVGAGRGIASYALARDGFATVALEPDPSALVGAAAIRLLAQQSDLAIDVVQQASEQLPFPDGVFDVVFARQVLHHTSDMPRACREFYRVLKPGGRFIAVREHVVSRVEDLGAFFDKHPLHHLYGGENAHLRSVYEHAIVDAGFRLERVVGPIESPINFEPQTLASLQAEIAKRLGTGVAPLVRWLLARPLLWRLARGILSRIDHRPGRLYSFVAERS